MDRRTGWVETDSEDNAEATASRAAETGRQHVVYSVDASFSAINAGLVLLQVKDGTTTVWEGYAGSDTDGSTYIEKEFPAGLTITLGAACSAVLAASGTGGTVGKVNIHGVTF